MTVLTEVRQYETGLRDGAFVRRNTFGVEDRVTPIVDNAIGTDAERDAYLEGFREGYADVH